MTRSQTIQLGDGAHPSFGPARFVGMISRHRYLVGAGNGGPPEVFDSLGRFLRTIGRLGSGPAEYRSASAFVNGPADSIGIVDPMNGRLSILDAEMRLVRAVSLPQLVVNGGIVWLPGQQGFAVGGLRSTSGEIGYRIHFFAPSGAFIRSIDETPHPIGPGTSAFDSARLLKVMPDGGLLAVSVSGSYTVDLWEPRTATLRARWVREAPWFGIEAGPFRSRVLAIDLDSAGLLWVLIAVPAKDWQRGAKPRVIGGIERTFEIVDRELIMDSVLEVLDLQRGRVITRLRTETSYSGLLPGGLLVPDGWEPGRIRLVPVTLLR